MTGPEHFTAAERLLDSADHYIYGGGGDPVTGAALAAMAQAHATLALVHATAENGVEGRGAIANHWREAMS